MTRNLPDVTFLLKWKCLPIYDFMSLWHKLRIFEASISEALFFFCMLKMWVSCMLSGNSTPALGPPHLTQDAFSTTINAPRPDAFLTSIVQQASLGLAAGLPSLPAPWWWNLQMCCWRSPYPPWKMLVPGGALPLTYGQLCSTLVSTFFLSSAHPWRWDRQRGLS